MRLTDQLWTSIDDVYAAILGHPFITGLTDGSLPHEIFRHFIAQDAHYLCGFARALTVCAAKAPDSGATVMFAEHAAGVRGLGRADGERPGEAAQVVRVLRDEVPEGLVRQAAVGEPGDEPVSYTHLTLPTTPYV